jgi:hypothetical protein
MRIMETRIPTEEQMNEIFKDFNRKGIQMIPATHDDNQIAVAIGNDPKTAIKVLMTLTTFE